MNLDDLTLGQLKQLQGLLGNQNQPNTSLKSYVGQYVIVRTRNEGINCGEVVAHDSTGIVLKDARRIYYHKPSDKKTSWYEGVSLSGLSDDSKISCPVSEKAIQSLKNHNTYEQP